MQELKAPEKQLSFSRSAIPYLFGHGFWVRTAYIEPRKELHWKIQVSSNEVHRYTGHTWHSDMVKSQLVSWKRCSLRLVAASKLQI